MNWFIFSILSVGALAVAELTQQRILNTTEKLDEKTSTTLTFLVQLIYTVPLLFITGLYKQAATVLTPQVFPALLLVSAISTLALMFYMRSFQVKSISYSTIFVSMSVIFSSAIGIVFFNESTTLMKFIGIALVLISVISVNISNENLEKNSLYGLAAAVLFAISYSIDKRIILQEIHPLVYLSWGFTLVSIFAFLLGPKHVVESIKNSKLPMYYSVFISGTGYFLYNLCTFFAYRVGGEVGKIDTINNSQIFLIILFEFIILKQRNGLLRKVATALVAFSGIAILGFLQ